MSSGNERVAVKRLVITLLLAVIVSWNLPPLCVTSAVSAETGESWKAEFDRLCGQSDTAAEMSIDALKKALEKCDALKPQIEALEATPRKVYLRRLQMCRNLFAYLLEGKEKK